MLQWVYLVMQEVSPLPHEPGTLVQVLHDKLE